mmetsp:Transcript_40008/g.95971  ORF Transcript_40008/g.95971 Transcript_40008/m.95971 type:complete len:620 (+) Transcript_40008:3-1862(+)
MSDEVEEAKNKILQLEAQIDEDTAKKTQLDADIEEHKKDREEHKSAIEAAEAIRKKEKAQYDKEAGDQGTSLDALNKAIPALERGLGVASLIQSIPGELDELRKVVVTSTSTNPEEKNIMLSFLTSGGKAEGAGTAEIVGMLKQIRDEIKEDLGGIVKAEEEAVAEFQALKASKKAAISEVTNQIEKKTVRSGELAVAIVDAKNDLKDTTGNLSENEKFLAGLSIQCDTKTKEFEERVGTRNQELVAIAEAIKMLNDDDALDLFKKALPTPGQPKDWATLLQTGRDSPSAKAVKFLQQTAKQADSVSGVQLKLISMMLKSNKVNFSKVLKMIDDMVVRMDIEQKDDDKHREWCQEEFRNKEAEEKMTSNKIEDLTTEIDEGAEEVSNLNDELAASKDRIAELETTVAQATDQRKKENAEYVQTQAELSQAKQLLEKVKNRLMKFYNKALYKEPEKTDEERIEANFSLLQRRNRQEPKAPETWEGGYEKKQNKQQGVTVLMDMLIKDLDKDLTEGQKDEEAAQKEYEDLMEESKKKRARESAAITDKTAAKNELDARLLDSKDSKKVTEEQLMSVKAYISDVHKSCDFLLDNYNFRKEMRAKERDNLKAAKAALQGAQSE